VLLRTLGREEVEKSGVRAASKNILDYLKTLAERGERHLDDALTAFEFHGAPATPELLSRLLKLHELYGIVNFSRYMDGKYDFDMIDMLIANGDPEKDKDKPLAVVFVARKGNFIFDTFSIGNFRKNLQDLAKSHKLVVYEVATEDGAIENMKKAVQLTAKGKAAFVGLAGHGGDLTTDFGQDVWDSVIDDKDKIRGRGAIDYGNTAEKMYIDVTDKDFFAAIEPFIEKDAIVLLYSCLTGKGGSEAVNLANTTAWYLSGRRVYAPTDSTIGTDLVLSASGLVIDINFLFDWDAKTPGTYRGIHF
jgi:hypothetical protein